MTVKGLKGLLVMIALSLVFSAAVGCRPDPGGLKEAEKARLKSLRAQATLIAAQTGEPPEPPASGNYTGWGNHLAADRTPGMYWKDGSHWSDGVSHQRPQLPLPEKALLRDHITCAQREVLHLTAFPDDKDIRTWYLQEDYFRISRQWEKNFATLLYGEHPKATEWTNRRSFKADCGERMQGP